MFYFLWIILCCGHYLFPSLAQCNGCEKVYPGLAGHSHRDLLWLKGTYEVFERYFVEVVLAEEANKLKRDKEDKELEEENQ